jgi:hypothetical protein
MKKLFALAATALTVAALANPASACGRYSATCSVEADAAAGGYGDGLVTAGRGGVYTDGTSGALARVDTDPTIYGAGVAFDERGLVMGSSGRRAAGGDFVMGSNSRTRADITSLPGPAEVVDANAGGTGIYGAAANGARTSAAGAAAGAARTSATSLDVPRRAGDDISAGAADMIAAAGSTATATDRTAAAASTFAETTANASVTD